LTQSVGDNNLRILFRFLSSETFLTGSLIRPILALDRLSFLEAEGRVGYRHGEKGAELEKMDYLEFIARVTSHIPD